MDYFTFSTGLWYRVDLDYKTKVYSEVEALERFTGLPDADPDTDEAGYNLMAAEAIDGLCLDRKFVFDGGPDKMEICDILTRNACLVHVKQRGSSSTLSHLFAQGVNSAERLLLDEEFRRQAREVIVSEEPSFADVLPLDRPRDPRSFRIVFVVITRSERQTPLTLPFFSVVGLRAAAARLRAFGFQISVGAVKEGVGTVPDGQDVSDVTTI